MKIGMSSTTHVAHGHVDDRLLDDPGPAAARAAAWPTSPIWGERLKQLHVEVDPTRCAAHGRHARCRSWRAPRTPSTPACCSSPTAHVIGTGGFIETPNQRLSIRHVPSVVTPDDLAQVPIVESRTASRSALGDVADVVEDHQPLFGDAVDQRRPRPAAGRREVPVGEHARRDPRRRAGARGAAARPARDQDRHDDLPAGDVHRGRARQPDARRCSSAACWSS